MQALTVARQADTALADPQSWRAWIDLAFENGQSQTILRRRHFGPLVIQRPFYPEGRTCHAYILHPPGGVVGGDRLSISVRCDNGASGLITTPGANRIYGSDGRCAVQQQTVSIGAGCFEWLPAETIYFDKARVSQRLDLQLTSKSRFMGWDISCFGRVAGNHRFTSGDVTNRLTVSRDGQPVLADRLRVTGAADLNQLSGMRASTVFGTLILAAPDSMNADTLHLVRSQLPATASFAATAIDGIITVRYLGKCAETARNGFITVWRALRPLITDGLPPTTPRIWAT